MGLLEELSIVGDDLEPQRLRQFEIILQDGIEPSRLGWILERLGAELSLVDDTAWRENAAVLASLPSYCNGCDGFGHTQEQCTYFAGRAGRHRTEEGFVPQASHVHGTYQLRKLGLNRNFERVIRINDKQWCVKEASGVHSNCLIDTMRQSLLRPDGIPNYDGYLDRVRRDLAAQLPHGEFRVIAVRQIEAPNYLEFLEHVRPVVRSLVRHSPDFGALTLDRGSDVWRPENMNFICADLNSGEFSTLPGSSPAAGGNDIFIARENGNHFLPLRSSHTPLEELLPWNTDIHAARRSATEEARRLAAEKQAAAAARARDGLPSGLDFGGPLSGAESELDDRQGGVQRERYNTH